jgi:type II secretory ATPase GspE/PulE/Tfp pilus assembly ATPase PilB-like protein
MYRSNIGQRFKKIIDKHERVAPELVEEIIADAVAYKASDIHFEPQDDFVLVRFRVDGVLQEAGTLPHEYYVNVVNKIKILSKLRIDNHFGAQDGSIRIKVESSDVDLRVSIIPTIYGEKVVMRILSSYVRSLALSDVGLSSKDSISFSKVAAKPFGMIIVSGPTGSGKTTTLYALLRTLHRPGINITTIEDPANFCNWLARYCPPGSRCNTCWRGA